MANTTFDALFGPLPVNACNVFLALSILHLGLVVAVTLVWAITKNRVDGAFVLAHVPMQLVFYLTNRVLYNLCLRQR